MYLTEGGSHGKVPEELGALSAEHVEAYRAACTGGTHNVHQCRVMLVGHEGAGKTSILDTLLTRPFQPQHLITNAMEVEIKKTINWQPHSGKHMLCAKFQYI